MPDATHDELLRTVGVLESRAASVDLMLCTALRVMLKCSPAAARAIFYALDSFPARRTLLTRVAEAVGDKEDEQLLAKMIASAERANNQRREVARGFIANERSG